MHGTQRNADQVPKKLGPNTPPDGIALNGQQLNKAEIWSELLLELHGILTEGRKRFGPAGVDEKR
jgi:hypothetical protein